MTDTQTDTYRLTFWNTLGREGVAAILATSHEDAARQLRRARGAVARGLISERIPPAQQCPHCKGIVLRPALHAGIAHFPQCPATLEQPEDTPSWG